MSILEKAKRDIERITSNTNEFARRALFIAVDGTQVEVGAIHTKHHFGVDAELQKWVNTKNAHISVSEKFLTDSGYPVRKNGEVFLQKHRVLVKDSTGTRVMYNIDQWFPNETIGLITCILGMEDDQSQIFDYKFSDDFE